MFGSNKVMPIKPLSDISNQPHPVSPRQIQGVRNKRKNPVEINVITPTTVKVADSILKDTSFNPSPIKKSRISKENSPPSTKTSNVGRRTLGVRRRFPTQKGKEKEKDVIPSASTQASTTKEVSMPQARKCSDIEQSNGLSTEIGSGEPVASSNEHRLLMQMAKYKLPFISPKLTPGEIIGAELRKGKSTSIILNEYIAQRKAAKELGFETYVKELNQLFFTCLKLHGKADEHYGFLVSFIDSGLNYADDYLKLYECALSMGDLMKIRQFPSSLRSENANKILNFLQSNSKLNPINKYTVSLCPPNSMKEDYKEQILKIVNFCPNLNSLRITGSSLGKQDPAVIFQNELGLNDLKIENVVIEIPLIEKLDSNKISSQFPHLKSLHLNFHGNRSLLSENCESLLGLIELKRVYFHSNSPIIEEIQELTDDIILFERSLKMNVFKHKCDLLSESSDSSEGESVIWSYFECDGEKEQKDSYVKTSTFHLPKQASLNRNSSEESETDSQGTIPYSLKSPVQNQITSSNDSSQEENFKLFF